MTEITFGRLQDLPPRDAWAHEAHAFTPWLAENIDHLSEAIGIPLELTGQEVRVETFAADILARNPQDDSVVLIENQLEITDHTHLGQIMTYLAGLEAQTVVWIAPNFREPHLSAIRWLNKHTADGFSFFAVRLRVVRIADSPYAPIFEVVEKPSAWDRQLKAEARTTDLKMLRRAYFEALIESMGGAEPRLLGQSLAYSIVDGSPLSIHLQMDRTRAHIFVRPEEPMEFGELTAAIQALAPGIDTASIRETRWGAAMYKSTASNLEVAETWPTTIEWHKQQLQSYLAAFQRAEGDA
jgi:hypothetical protein